MKEKDYLEWPDWADADEVSKKLKITQRTLQRWRLNGVIPYSRVKGRCYYRMSDIIALLKSNYNKKKGDPK